MTKNELALEIREKKTWEGCTMYYLYVDGSYVTGSSDLEKIKAVAQTAKDIFEAGDNVEKVIFSETLKK